MAQRDKKDRIGEPQSEARSGGVPKGGAPGGEAAKNETDKSEASDDLDKKLERLEKRLALLDPLDEIVRHLNPAVFEEIYAEWLGVLIERSIALVLKFNRFFKESSHTISVNAPSVQVAFADEGIGSVLTRLSGQLVTNKQRLDTPEIHVRFQAHYNSFIRGGLKTFDCSYGWAITFDKTKYVIAMDEFAGHGGSRDRIAGRAGGIDELAGSKTVVERLLSQPLSDAAIDGMVREFGETIYTHLIEHAKNIGIDLI